MPLELHQQRSIEWGGNRESKNGIIDYSQYLRSGFAKRYLSTYLQEIHADERAIMNFLVDGYRHIEGAPRMLDIGCGPGVQHVLPAVPYVSTIDMADYLPDNLEELRKWHQRDPESQDWHHFTRLILEQEGISPSISDIQQREEALRSKMRTISHADVLQEHPLGEPLQYPVVGFFYCAEAVASTKRRWDRVMENVCGMVSPQGWLFMSSLRNADYYTVEYKNGEVEKIPCANVSKQDFEDILPSLGFDSSRSDILVVATPDMAEHGIREILLVAAKKK